MTPAQSRVLQAVEEETRDGWPASTRALQKRLGLGSTASVHKHLRVLIRAGLVERRGRQGYKIVEEELWRLVNPNRSGLRLRREHLSPRLSVGDEVAFAVGNHHQHAIIIEDRGDIGVCGSQIWRVTLIPHEKNDQAIEFELDENLLEVVLPS